MTERLREGIGGLSPVSHDGAEVSRDGFVRSEVRS